MSTPATIIPSNPRPSDLRRRTLNTELSIPLVSNFFPIHRYYDAAQKCYESFQTCYAENNLDDAYVYGKRYCLFCMDAIPTHNYYNATGVFAKLKNTHIAQTNQVYRQLEQVVIKMDIEEQEKERLRELQKERERQERLERFQNRYQDQKKKHPAKKTDVQASALSKLERLSHPNGVATQSSSSQQQRQRAEQQQQQQIRRDPSGEPPMGMPSSRYRVVDDSEDDEQQHQQQPLSYALPPPIPPPSLGLPPPPSYEQIRSSSRNFLGPAAGSVSPQQQQQDQLVIVPPPIELKLKQQQQIPMHVLQQQYLQAYQQFTRQGKISISALNTYQGRVEDSTNGCTVISALVAATHMRKNNRPATSISDDDVVHVIDRVCGPVLRQIRSKLGLDGTHALLIPSDVHDHLVDSNVLSQDHFEGAAGGNVMDIAHMGEFLKLLSVGDSGQGAFSKAAATFFFREHVISIVKYFNNNGSQACYDLIDSLPSSTVSNGNGRNSLAATRTRCVNLESLHCLLRWYTSRKFTDSNCSYIDSHKWDDGMADFDPRVFQGFVWMEKAKGKN